jgi:signal transduction histidine kinase
MTRRRPIRWLRDHPVGADWLLAGVLTVLSVIGQLMVRESGLADPTVLTVALAIGGSLPLGWRRRSPTLVLLAVTLSQMGIEALNAAGGWLGVIIAAYTLGAYRSGRELWRAAISCVMVIIAFVIIGALHGDAPWQAVISAPVVVAGAVLVGDKMRLRRERSADLAERAEHAERERSLLANQHVQDERTRIARELHDVVAHSVSLMVIQTAAARRQLLAGPEGVDASLEAVEETGRTAMNEMRRILGVLRDTSGAVSLAPQPGLAAIEVLTAAATDLPVSVRSQGNLAHLPTGVEVSAYRIVQEALTNVRRHAGPVHQVDVSMVREGSSLTVEVTDDGRGAAASAAEETGTGFGLVGMRERVAAFDGQLTAGPRPGGGWRVRAVFPVGVQ